MAEGKKFFIIDDDTDDRDMFCEALQEVIPDAICYVASNGHSAITALDTKSIEIPDLIFLDINMPVMNGWQCLSRLRHNEQYKQIPVIIYSTSSYQEDLEKAQQEGALCFFPKPANFKQLKHSLEILASHLQRGTLSSLANNSAAFLK